MPDKLLDLNIPQPSIDVATASGYTTPEAKAISLNVPAPTISVSPVPISGAALTSTIDLYVPTNITVTYDRAIASGGDAAERTCDVPQPTVSYLTENIFAGQYSRESTLYVPDVAAADYLITNMFTGKFSFENTLYTPVAAISNLYEKEEIFDFDRVLSYVGTNYIDQTEAANNMVTNDVDLIRSGAGLGDGIMLGRYTPDWYGATIIVSTAGAGTYTMVWEYWNGSAWSALTTVNEYEYNRVEHFKAAGYYRIKFVSPPYWDPLSVDLGGGVVTDELYWVRCRLNTTGVTTRPLGKRIWGRRYPRRLRNARQTMNDEPGTVLMTEKLPRGIVYEVNKRVYWQFKMVDYADYASQRSYVNPRVYIGRGTKFKMVTNTVTEVGNGWYVIELPREQMMETVVLRAIGPGAAQCDMRVDMRSMISFHRLTSNSGTLKALTWGQVKEYKWYDVFYGSY